MRPAPFELFRPESLREALAALAAGAEPLAGGQSMLQSMRLGRSQPEKIVDLSRLDCLSSEIGQDGEFVSIGALVTHRQLAESAIVEAQFPWLCEAARLIGDVQVRNLGTTLGNVCWADPRANMAVAMLASGAQVTILKDPADPIKETLPLDEFFTGFRGTVLRGSLAQSLLVPPAPNARGVYLEFSRQPQDLAIVNVCAVADANGLRIALGGIAPIPIRNSRLEAEVQSGAPVSDVAQLLNSDARCQPPQDSFGSREYKLHVAAELTLRALRAIGK